MPMRHHHTVAKLRNKKWHINVPFFFTIDSDDSTLSNYTNTMLQKLHGCDKDIWFGTNYDLTDPRMSNCGYVVTDIADYWPGDDDSVVFYPLIKLYDLRRNNPEMLAWLDEHCIVILKFIPLTNKRHDFSNSIHGIIFKSQEDCMMFKLMWGHI